MRFYYDRHCVSRLRSNYSYPRHCNHPGRYFPPAHLLFFFRPRPYFVTIYLHGDLTFPVQHSRLSARFSASSKDATSSMEGLSPVTVLGRRSRSLQAGMCALFAFYAAVIRQSAIPVVRVRWTVRWKSCRQHKLKTCAGNLLPLFLKPGYLRNLSTSARDDIRFQNELLRWVPCCVPCHMRRTLGCVFFS